MKKKAELLALNYEVRLTKSSSGGFFAEIPELPGCITEADTLEEVYEMIEDAKKAWISTAQELGRDVPMPAEGLHKYSGKFVVRIPKGLHRDLADLAKREGVSLNQLTTSLLSKNYVIESLENKMQAYTVKKIRPNLGSKTRGKIPTPSSP